MTEPFRVACVQTSSAREVAANIASVVPMIHQAADRADLIILPETVDIIEPNRPRLLAKAARQDAHPALAAFRAAARETGRWILVGSLVVRLDEEERLANRSFLIDDSGEVRATYDKVHMFDVDLEKGESYRESALYRPGERAVVAQTPWGGLGLTICYDLRFAYLHRHLAQAGARFIAVPAAFTRPTGAAHWHVLLRARAIETGCYVFAAAQCGGHAEGRLTYGHSLIIDPWGQILAEAGESPGIISATVDPARVDEVRAMVPALRHDRALG